MATAISVDEARPRAVVLRLQWRDLPSSVPQVALAAAAFGLYAALSLARYQHMDAGIDLAIFGQAVKKYAHWQLPWSDIKAVSGFNLLGDHFSPVVALAAPAYWLVPHVWVLLVVQAGLIGLTTFLIARVVTRRLGLPTGLLVAVIYALAWGTQGLALFDFHEVAFALPLVAMCYLRLLDGRNRDAVLWALPLMLVKEDSVFLLLGLALVLLVRRSIRLAALVSAYAIATFTLIVGVLIPHISYYGHYTYWSSSAAGDGGGFVGRGFDDLLRSFTSGQAPQLLAVLLVPTLGLALRSPMMLGVVPPLLSRLTSPDPAYWGAGNHYNATITVITVIALADAVARSDRRQIMQRVLPAGLAAAVVLSCWSPAGDLVTTLRNQRCAGCEWDITKVLFHVPDGARVTAADYAASYLVDRTTVIGLHESIVDSTGRPVLPDYVVVDRIHDQGWQAAWGNAQFEGTDWHEVGEAVRLNQPRLKDYDFIVIGPGRYYTAQDMKPLPDDPPGRG